MREKFVGAHDGSVGDGAATLRTATTNGTCRDHTTIDGARHGFGVERTLK